MSRYYAIGDVHGRFDLLSRALDEIGDLEAQGATLVTLGDYVDRGPESREVVDALMRRSSDPRVVCLRGNHEEMMVNGLADPDAELHWLVNGGAATLASYGGNVPPDHLAWLQAQGHVGQRENGAEVLGNASELQKTHGLLGSLQWSRPALRPGDK